MILGMWQQTGLAPDCQQGRYQSLQKVAEAEGGGVGWAFKILRLAQLAPEVIEAAVTQGKLKVGLSELLTWFPDEWEGQRGRLVE